MNTIPFYPRNRIKMIAHRGVSGLERENTCPAFIAAGVKSYYGIETDVHVTKDGKYIIHHDDSTKRLTGQDLMIRETDFATLRALTMLDTDSATSRGDLFLPTLEEYLAICRKYGKTAVLELKEEMNESSVAGIASTVEAMGMFLSTVFISFSANNLLALRQSFSQADAQFLSDKLSDQTVNFILEHHLDADIHHRALTKDFVDLMHANGRVVNAWTVNKPEDAMRLDEMGVDMITTNILE